MSDKSFNGKLSLAEYNELVAFRDSREYTNFGQVVSHLWKHYQKTQGKPSGAAPKAPASNEQYFVAKIDPRGKSLVEELRQDMFNQNLLSDGQIFMHFVRQHKATKSMQKLVIDLPKKLRQMVTTRSKNAVEEGEAKNVSEWVSRYLLRSLKGDKPPTPTQTPKTEKPKKKSFWDE